MSSRQILHANIMHLPKEQPIRSKKFSQQEVDLAKTPLFFPEGYEKIFLLLYFVTLPYIAGFLFLFLYVSKLKLEVFLSVYKNSSFILTWTVGYEIMAAMVLLWIVKMAVGFGNYSRKSSEKKFHRP